MSSENISKAERYREAFGKLGLDVPFKDFVEYCKKTWNIEPPNSAFYSIRGALQKAASPQTATKSNAAKKVGGKPKTITAPVRTVADLPEILANTRALLDTFEGDKESLIRFVAAL